MHRNRSNFINFGAPTQNPASVFLWVVNLKFIQFDWFLPKYIFAAEQFPDRLVSTSIHFFDAETVKLLALLNIFVWDFLLLLDRFAPFYIYYYVQSSHGCVKQYVIFYLLTFKWRVDILTSLTSPPPPPHTHIPFTNRPPSYRFSHLLYHSKQTRGWPTFIWPNFSRILKSLAHQTPAHLFKKRNQHYWTGTPFLKKYYRLSLLF